VAYKSNRSNNINEADGFIHNIWRKFGGSNEEKGQVSTQSPATPSFSSQAPNSRKKRKAKRN